MYKIETVAKTEFASKYLQQLCKHFAHKVPSEFDHSTGRVEFPFGHCQMGASDDELTITCTAENEENLTKSKHVIDSHLERFAWKEKLTLDWTETYQES